MRTPRAHKVHHAYPLATHTDCGRPFSGRLERGHTITCNSGSGRTLEVSNSPPKVTCQRCIEARI